jgi:NTE family protein
MDDTWRQMRIFCRTVTIHILSLVLLVLTGCVGSADFRPINAPGQNTSAYGPDSSLSSDETLVALAFSGGGMRASAFSYGVLKTLAATPSTVSTQQNLANSVDFVSGVSGGSVTAAYFALKGPEGFSDFRQTFLDKNAEETLNTDVSLGNILSIIANGGANDRKNLPLWLDDNVFHDATYADVFGKKRTKLWIGASDIFNRTSFIFMPAMFAPLCSDLSQLKISDAVAASAAVPGAFTPINLESFAGNCEWKEPAWGRQDDLYYSQHALLSAMRHYRNAEEVKYIKLLDGGLTDNFGVAGVVLARLAQGNKYAPLSKNEAISLKQLLFIVVNSGRGPVSGEWNRRADNPSILTLASAVTDTAIESNTRMTYDFFLVVMKEWEKGLIEWRCALPETERQAARQRNKSWRCDDVHFFVTQVSFADAGPERQKRLDTIPTRFMMLPEDVDFVVESANIAMKNNATFNAFLKRLH